MRAQTDRSIALRRMALVFLLALSAALLGANCEPSPAPGCAECPTGSIRTCYDRCVPLGNVGDRCSREVCPSTTTGPCGGNLSCTRDPDGVDRCRDLGFGLGEPCGGYTGSDPCPNGLFCRSAQCLPINPNGAICSAVVLTIGAACDGDLAKPSITTACAPCGSGLTCYRGTCQPICRVDADCPCGRGMSCSNNHVEHPEAPANVCVKCKKLGDTDCNAYSPCCDDGTACFGNRCCKPTGSSCSTKGDCCLSDICVAGKCQPCGKRDVGGCGTSEDCCAGEGLECASGICRKRCVAPTGTCPVPGKLGACAVGNWTCPSEFADPVCTSTVTPKAEVCDNIDNDCNGVVDDIPPATCTTTPLQPVHPVSCPSWFTVVGTEKCRDGKKVCDANGNFCTACNTYLPGGAYCGSCEGKLCTGLVPDPEKECAPRTFCSEVGEPCLKLAECSGIPGYPTCWLPDRDNGRCVP